ncbi:hypothetical protein [Nocardia sp. NPDC004722]
MGSAEATTWLRDGYLSGDPLRSSLFVALMFLSMPFQLLTGNGF